MLLCYKRMKKEIFFDPFPPQIFTCGRREAHLWVFVVWFGSFLFACFFVLFGCFLVFLFVCFLFFNWFCRGFFCCCCFVWVFWREGFWGMFMVGLFVCFSVFLIVLYTPITALKQASLSLLFTILFSHRSLTPFLFSLPLYFCGLFSPWYLEVTDNPNSSRVSLLVYYLHSN